MQKNQILTINNKDYPVKLKNIYNPPICLFVNGNSKILNNKIISIVGSRECSQYGKQMAFEFAFMLAKNNFIIASGGARGIDSFAHMGALKAGGKTIEVKGCSLEFIYPPENKNLEDAIVKNDGAVISEYMRGTKQNKFTFPQRNRIISGIADAILVIEAGKNSGALITVDYALEQGKDVFAIPRKYRCKILSSAVMN